MPNGNGDHRNIALLIDADNASSDSIDAVLTVLAELGSVNVRRAYGNWKKPALKPWEVLMHRYAIEPQQQFDLTKGKNATDMRMTIDAMDLLSGGRVGGFGIMSSDSDFMPLAMRIRQDGLPVYGFGRATTPDGFRSACTRFIDTSALVETERDEPAIEAPLVKPQAAPGTTLPIDDEVLQVLGAAFKAAKRDDKGFARLNEIGQIAANRSSFDARSYGYSKLINMIEAIPNFQVERREGGVFVKRVR